MEPKEKDILFSMNKVEFPRYPITCYVTGGLNYSGGYRSLELQCLDADGIPVYDHRKKNDGSFSGSGFSSNGLSDGCVPVQVHQFNAETDAPASLCSIAAPEYCETVQPSDFEDCVAFGGGGIWCDNPLGECPAP